MAGLSEPTACTKRYPETLTPKGRKIMLMPSTLVGLLGIVSTAVLLAADWYIWHFRHRISQPGATHHARRPVADGRHIIHVGSVSGRELVASLAPQSPNRSVVSCEQVHGA